jgi:hypothetical protein
MPQSETNDEFNLLFADDLCYVKLFKNTKLVENKVNLYLKELENWLNSRWRLKAATHKCSYIQIENKKSNTNLNLKFYGEIMINANDQTFLGIQFDRLINYNQHVTNIVDRANKRLNIIKMLVNKKWKLSPRTLVNIYKTLMRSVLEYSAILFPACQ